MALWKQNNYAHFVDEGLWLAPKPTSLLSTDFVEL